MIFFTSVQLWRYQKGKTSVNEDRENSEPLYTIAENVNGYKYYGEQYDGPKEFTNGPSKPTSGYIFKKNKISVLETIVAVSVLL